MNLFALAGRWRAAASPRSGGILLTIVWCILLSAMLLLLALSRFRSGTILQVGKQVEQERLLLTAQSACAEMLAQVRLMLNDTTKPLGDVLWRMTQAPFSVDSSGYWRHTQQFLAARFPQATRIGRRNLGHSATVTGAVTLALKHVPGTFPLSFQGYVELIAQAEIAGSPPLSLTERRDLRLVDMRDPFFDKYALYLKNFCVHLNHPKRRLIVEGVVGKPTVSRVYLGNRFYPPCAEFPRGERSATPPPVLVDLDFEGDRLLIANFLSSTRAFPIRDSAIADQTRDQFFWIKDPPIPFKNLQGRFALPEFFFIDQVRDYYQRVIDSARPHGGVENSMAYDIMKDFQAAGGKPEQSKVFKAIVETCAKGWSYQYGFTDYAHLINDEQQMTSLTRIPHCTGILSYFTEYQDYNVQRLLGGRMPLLFGANRTQPVLVEGPVYLRFFKIAFFDDFTYRMPLLSQTVDLRVEEVPLSFRRPDRSPDFAGKNIGPIDDIGLERCLMSRGIESFPLNNLYFAEHQARLQPAQSGSQHDGGDIYPTLAPGLQTISRIYPTASAFLQARVNRRGGGPVLELDGHTVILGVDGSPLDLSEIPVFRGKGMIILLRGMCFLGNLRRETSPVADFLRLYVVQGGLRVKANGRPVSIEASLIATSFQPGNRGVSGWFDTAGHQVTIRGNLVVDDLLELRNVPERGNLTITHDDALFFPPPPPYRVTVGELRTANVARIGDG